MASGRLAAHGDWRIVPRDATTCLRGGDGVQTGRGTDGSPPGLCGDSLPSGGWEPDYFDPLLSVTSVGENLTCPGLIPSLTLPLTPNDHPPLPVRAGRNHLPPPPPWSKSVPGSGPGLAPGWFIFEFRVLCLVNLLFRAVERSERDYDRQPTTVFTP